MDVIAYILSRKYTDKAIEGIGGTGKDGVTFTPSVSEEGILSWTNNGNLPNPDPVNIKGKDGSFSNIYVTESNYEESDVDILNRVVESPQKGDIAIIKRLITENKYLINSYIYNSNWEALTGSYRAEDVYFTSDLVITADIGVQKIDSSGSKTINTTGKNVKQVFDMIVAEEKNPTITQPSVSINSSDLSAKEVGTMISVRYNCSFNPGNYQYGPETGVTPTKWTVTDTNSNTINTQTGTFPEFQITDSTRYSISVSVEYTDGAIPKTNLGNDYSEGKILQGTKSSTKGTLSGYRNTFYGTLSSKEESVTSDIIRTLNKSNKALSNGSTFNVSIPVGAIRVVISYPNTLRDVSSISDVNGLGAEIKTSFTKSEIEVFGNNNYDSIIYKTYILDFANPNDTANTYKVTI